MKSSIIFIALVGAVSSNYAAAADHPNMNMLRGIIPAEELLANCSCMRTRQYIAGSCCGTGCDCSTSTNFNCCGCSDTPNDNCPTSGGSTERITDNSGSGKCKTKKTEASEDVEYEFEEVGQSCDCNTNEQCDEDEECEQMEDKCGVTDPTETSGDVKAEYEFEE